MKKIALLTLLLINLSLSFSLPRNQASPAIFSVTKTNNSILFRHTDSTLTAIPCQSVASIVSNADPSKIVSVWVVQQGDYDKIMQFDYSVCGFSSKSDAVDSLTAWAICDTSSGGGGGGGISQSTLDDSILTLRSIRKVDTSYLFRNSSLDSICQVTIINGLSYRSCAKDSLPTVSSTSTTTFTNKRITARVDSTTSSATPTINTDNVDTYKLTAQAVDITSFTTNLSGTPTDDQILHIIIKGTGARTISWGSSFEASTVALPTTTVSTDRLDVYFVWNTFTSKWRCGGVW